MDTPATIAAAVWSYPTRTLASGTPPPPVTQAEAIAADVWAYSTRTLTGGGGATLSTDPGVYVLTGSDALLRLGRAVVTDPGAYALTGSDASLRAATVLVTEAGVYVLTGTAATLDLSAVLTAEPGSYVLTGAEAEFVTGAMFAEPGSYLLAGAAAGLIYSNAPPVFGVHEVLTRRMRRSPSIADEDRWLFHHALQIDLETGVGLVSGEGSDPQIMLRWSDDGGETWSDEHWTSAGRMGEYQTRAIWQRLGRSRDRVYETTVTSPVAWNLISALLSLEPGIH